ncbi:MAG: SH3 domain-containing protein [Dehalococcoidia bacterium]
MATPSPSATVVGTQTAVAMNSSPSPGPPGATSTAVGSAVEAHTPEGLQAFARLVDEALAQGDIDAVTSRVRGAPEVAFSQWGQAASTLAVDRARTDLTQLLTRTRASDRDSYGMAAPKVWWVGLDMSRPSLVVTAISLDEATGYRRLGLVLQLRYCEDGCAAEDRGRWMIGGIVLDWGDGLLTPSEEFVAAFGRTGETYRRPLVLTPEIREAALSVARDFGEQVRAIPDCVPSAPCVTTTNPGVSADLGIMRFAYQEPVPGGGGALVFAGRTADGSWRFWFGTQNVQYRLVDLPGDILVCADGDGLNVRERPDGASPVVGFVADLSKLRAEEFLLTEPGSTKPDLVAGTGWYRVGVGSPAQTAWVASAFVADARSGSCALRDAVERP